MAVKQKKNMVKKGKTSKRIKKSFYDISAPMTAAKISLYASDPDELDGKVVKLDLTRSLRGKSFELKLRVKAEDEKLEGIPFSLILAGSYVRRSMRKGADYVEDSFEAECRDCFARVKPFLITRNRVSRSIRRALREMAKKNIEGYLKARTSKEIFSEIMTNKLQKQLSARLRKIYPLALCEIRVFKVERRKEKKEKEEAEVKKVEKVVKKTKEKKEKNV